MDLLVCSQCGIEIAGKVIRYRNKVFCSDECCEEFDEQMAAGGLGPMDNLDEDDIDEESDFDDDLGYRDDDTADDFDDEFDIRPDDF